MLQHILDLSLSVVFFLSLMTFRERKATQEGKDARMGRLRYALGYLRCGGHEYKGFTEETRK